MAAMKQRFDKYAQRMNEGEKELVWRQITAENQQERRRRRQFWTAFGASGAVVTAALVVIVMLSGEDPQEKIQKIAMSPEPRGEMTMDKAPGTMGLSDVQPAPGVQLEKPEGAFDEELVVEASAPPEWELASTRGDKSTRVDSPDRTETAAGATPEKVKAAAPAAPEDSPTVASSQMASRGAAAVSDDVKAPGTASEYGREIQVLALTDARMDSSDVTILVNGVVATIYGRVSHPETGRPIIGARIVVEGTKYSALSEEDGGFSIVLPTDIYTLTVSAIGFDAVSLEDLDATLPERQSLVFAMRSTSGFNEMETIVVEGEMPKVDVKSSSVSRQRDSKSLKPFAVDNVQEAMALDSGVKGKSGEVHIRGGRSGEVSMLTDNVPVNDPRGGSLRQEARTTSDISLMSSVPPTREKKAREEHTALYRGTSVHRRGCWIPPDYHEPNGEPFDAMYFRNYGTNPFVMTEEDPYSTFAADVDEASYTVMRRYVNDGHLPPSEAIRVEEFVNYFDAGYPRLRQGDFALRVDGAPSPFGQGYHLLRLGVQARDIDRDERKPANLVFVIDTSGSMGRENRLGLVKRALHLLLEELRDSDTVGIVEYGSRGREVLRPTSVEDRWRIVRAIDGLRTNGSTNAEEGLDLGYAMASRIYDREAINRLILCSDGVANTGETQAERILDRVRYESDRGIHLSTVGFGMGNYNDVLMEKLANKGDGNYHYVDRLDEAERVFRENLTGTLQTVARDVKIQVEFDPEQVLRWRLLGYENRDVADEDFRDDTVDAGEIGAGHTVVALYEVKLSREAARYPDGRMGRDGRDPLRLGEFRLRYEYPAGHERAGEVVEIDRALNTAALSRSFERADASFRLAAMAAEYAEVLRGSYWAKGSRLGDLAREVESLATELRGDEDPHEFARLVKRAALLEGRRDRD